MKLIYHFEQNILENSDLVKKYLEDKKVSFYKRYINLILRRKDHLLKMILRKLNMNKIIKKLNKIMKTCLTMGLK